MPSPVPLIFLAFSLVWLQAFSQASAQMPSRGIYSDSRNERMPINVPRYLHLDLSKHVMRNISRFRLRAHPLKVEAAAWLEDGSCVCDQCPGEDEHVQNEVHALLFCQDRRVCELIREETFLLSVYAFF